MKKITIAVLASLLLASCATTGRISTDSDPSQNFDTYKSFSWAGDNPYVAFGEYNIPALTQAKILNAIKTDLQKRGYNFVVDAANADFVISYTVGARDKSRVDTVPAPYFENRQRWQWGRQYFPYFPTRPATETIVRSYTEGTLSIDIYDVARRSPVWHGHGSKRLSQKELRAEQDTIAVDVGLILSGFPPQ